MTEELKENQKISVHLKITSTDDFREKISLFDTDNSIPSREILEIHSNSNEISMPFASIVNMERFLYSEFRLKSNHHTPEEEQCPICMVEFCEDDSSKIVKLNRCEGHYFHAECIEMCYSNNHLKCPICGVIYGIMTGDMPKGIMKVYRHTSETLYLEGYLNMPSYEIIYDIKSGKKGNIKFPATYRNAFLPCNDEGKEVLRLLVIAFERKLTFTIGTSVTTGRTNQIV